jgi:hypothetical protein
MAKHYDYDDVGYGVILTDPVSGDDVLLQGDEGSDFLATMEEIDSIWTEGNPNPDIFEEQEDHTDLIIGNYFDFD